MSTTTDITIRDISEKIDLVLRRLEIQQSKPERISFPDFCKDFGISRVTGYAWNDRGLIRIEKIGGRNFVIASSVSIRKKYERVTVN